MPEKTEDGPEQRKAPAEAEAEVVVDRDEREAADSGRIEADAGSAAETEPEPKPKRRIKPLDKKLPEHPDGLAKRSEWFRKRRGEPD